MELAVASCGPLDVATDIVGNLAIRVGLATVVFGVLVAVTTVPAALAYAFAAIVVLAAVRAIYRLRTHPSTQFS